MAILNTNEIMFTAFEPKVQNRFIMYIDGIPAFLVKKVGRPNIQFGDITLDHINTKRKLKGKESLEHQLNVVKSYKEEEKLGKIQLRLL